MFLWGTGVSTLAFIACALSPSYAVLIAARVVQGIGAGLILSCGPALATSLFPEAMRTQVLARYMMMFGIGSALGPSVFGWLVERFGWSAVFSFRAPVAAAAFVLAWSLPRPGRGEPESFDAAGGVLLALALSCMLLALNRLRSPGPETAVFAVLAIGGFALFYRQERRTPRPIIDFGLFRSVDFAVINVSNTLINLSAFSIMLLAPFYLARIQGLSLPAAGLVLAASPVGIIVAAPMAGRLARDHRPRLIALVGTALSGVGLFGISLSGDVPDIAILVLSMVVQGVGVGLFQVAYFDIVTATIPLRNRGVAGALGMATRSIGTVTGATGADAAVSGPAGAGGGWVLAGVPGDVSYCRRDPGGADPVRFAPRPVVLARRLDPLVKYLPRRWALERHHGATTSTRVPKRWKSAALKVSRRVSPCASMVATILASCTCLPPNTKRRLRSVSSSHTSGPSSSTVNR